MAFTIFPPDKPLELVPQQTGAMYEFFVKVGAEQMFLRAIALWTDNTALEAAAPTFHLQAPGGVITPVKPGPSSVTLTGETGTAGVVTCERFDDDIYLVTISDINEDVANRKWKMRIKNNAAKPLRFVWVSSDKDSNTRQPWAAFGEGATAAPALVTIPRPSPGDFVPVSNWGTGALEIHDAPNKPVGGPQSPVILEHRPAVVALHGVDHIVLRRGPSAPMAVPLTHTFSTNDEEPTHNKSISIKLG